jgi:hypothetical protein
MRDAFDGERFFVQDITASYEQVAGDYGLLRVQLLDGRYILAGNGTGVLPEALGGLKAFVRKESGKARQGEAEFARANSHLLRRWVADWHMGKMESLRVVDRVGDEIELCTGRYEVLDRSALLGKLRAIDELREEKSQGAAVRFAWVEPGEGPRSVNGSIEVTEAGLRLETTSRRQLALGRGLLEFHAGKELQYLGDASTTLDDIKRGIRAGKKRPRPGRAPSQEECEALLAFKEQHYATWPDIGLPALRGKTPREAVRTKAGREAVLRLLRDMESDERRADAAEGPAYDFGKLRRALGLANE